jgi:hypothetical protein
MLEAIDKFPCQTGNKHWIVPGVKKNGRWNKITFSDEEKQDMWDMRKRGDTLEFIASKYKISVNSVWKFTHPKTRN